MMFSKRLAVWLSVPLIAMGIVGGTEAASSAHHDTVVPTVQCVKAQPNTWLVDWSIKNSEADKTQTATSRLGQISIGKGGTGHQTETVTAPADLTLDVQGVWSNGVTNNATGSLPDSAFKTDCWPVQPQPRHETRKHTTKVDCKTHSTTTTREARDSTWVWDGESMYVEVWGDWYVTSVTTHHVGNVPACEVNRHAHVTMTKHDGCNCFRDWVRLSYNHDKIKVYTDHPTKLTWKFTVVGKKIGDKQYLVPLRLGGHSNYTLVTTYTVHTTNKACPCHKTHTCHHVRPGSPHHCPTVLGRLSGKPCHR